MSFKVKAIGFGDLNKNLRKIVVSVNSEQSGIAEAIAQAVGETIIPVARSNVYDRFDTSGRLADAIQVRKVNQWQVNIGVFAPHGAVHEFGGTFEVTDKQRAFFWHMFRKEGDEKWKALALSKTYTIPARPYLMPAIDQEIGNAMSVTADNLYKYWLGAVGKIPAIPVSAISTKVINPKGGFCGGRKMGDGC